MPFKIKNNCVFFRDYDLSEYMNIKEVNVNIEENEAFIVAEFKADVDINANGFLACMLENMSEENINDLLEQIKYYRSK